MKDNAKNTKISLIISRFSVIISSVAVIISGISLRYAIANRKVIGSAVTIFCCMIIILCTTISSNKRYENSSK